MESAELSDDELRAERRRAAYLLEIADNAGEADASALWSSVVRSIDNETRARASASAG
jgi:hypothetical protein